MSVPKGRRRLSRYEVEHHFFQLRDSITELMLLDFGFSADKCQDKIEWYARSHQSAANVSLVKDENLKLINVY